MHRVSYWTNSSFQVKIFFEKIGNLSNLLDTLYQFFYIISIMQIDSVVCSISFKILKVNQNEFVMSRKA